jgi:hypothetical protein
MLYQMMKSRLKNMFDPALAGLKYVVLAFILHLNFEI